MEVRITRQAKRQLESLPGAIQERVLGVFERLGRWPDVSGARPLSGRLAGWYRVRTGDYRIRFAVVGGKIIVDRIGHRKQVYEE